MAENIYMSYKNKYLQVPNRRHKWKVGSLRHLSETEMQHGQ